MVVEKECLNAALRPIPTANLVSALVASAEVLDIHTGLMKIVVDAEPQIVRHTKWCFNCKPTHSLGLLDSEKEVKWKK